MGNLREVILLILCSLSTSCRAGKLLFVHVNQLHDQPLSVVVGGLPLKLKPKHQSNCQAQQHRSYSLRSSIIVSPPTLPPTQTGYGGDGDEEAFIRIVKDEERRKIVKTWLADIRLFGVPFFFSPDGIDTDIAENSNLEAGQSGSNSFVSSVSRVVGALSSALEQVASISAPSLAVEDALIEMLQWKAGTGGARKRRITLAACRYNPKRSIPKPSSDQGSSSQNASPRPPPLILADSYRLDDFSNNDIKNKNKQPTAEGDKTGQDQGKADNTGAGEEAGPGTVGYQFAVDALLCLEIGPDNYDFNSFLSGEFCLTAHYIALTPSWSYTQGSKAGRYLLDAAAEIGKTNNLLVRYHPLRSQYGGLLLESYLKGKGRDGGDSAAVVAS